MQYVVIFNRNIFFFLLSLCYQTLLL